MGGDYNHDSLTAGYFPMKKSEPVLTLNQKEKTEIKNTLRFLIEKKHKTSGGHGGFHLNELQPLLDEMVKKGEITRRDTIHCNKYFLNNSKL